MGVSNPKSHIGREATTVKCALPASVFMMLCLLALSSGASAETSTLEVSIENRTTSPALPTVNLRSEDTIVVRLVDLPEPSSGSEGTIGSYFDLPSFMEGEGNCERSDRQSASNRKFCAWDALGVEGDIFVVNFESCAHLSSEGARLVGEVVKAGGPSCGFAVKAEYASRWTVIAESRSVVLTIEENSADAGETTTRTLMSVPIRLEEKPWALDWSAGFSILNVNHQRYRLEATDGATDQRTLIRASDEESSYQFVALAHYLPFVWKKRIGVAAGLSTDVPVEALTISLGVTFPVRTLPLVNTGYLTIGGAFTRRDTLRREFEGQASVAANLTSETLVQGEYEVVPFVALTFAFFGGEKEFKGVYSGRASKTGSSPANSQN